MLPNVIVTMNASPKIADLVLKKFEGKAKVKFLHGISGPERKKDLETADVILSMFFSREIERGEETLLEKARLLQMVTAGVDSLPFDRIPTHMAVASNRNGWSRQISEHALALALACSRRITYFHNRLREGAFIQRSREYPLTSLHGKTLGILGYGGIGRASAKLFRAMGMEVMAVNRSGRSDGTAFWFGTLDRLDEVLEASDVVLISLPLNFRTRGLIGSRELALMKDDTILINIARAAIVEEKALYDHLRNHPRFQAGLDVWWEEPTFGGKTFGLQYPFFELPNLVGSPHNSNQMEGDLLLATERALDNVLLYLSEGRAGNIENRRDYI